MVALEITKTTGQMHAPDTKPDAHSKKTAANLGNLQPTCVSGFFEGITALIRYTIELTTTTIEKTPSKCTGLIAALEIAEATE
ncbi:hypothetical protein [Wolbachia endosymbiont (group A) of Anoplius nigerrimus]|uniref:hypothetical protein n=1 Tax=Wolbachia endosymbiont (group A) of Anoplius nigerrimus TaxID=2953979 RepID=UPI002232C130|nr:hypothetical protein [Wolbachia endosymbiont (group A) of Anoplius nigerrimus]